MESCKASSSGPTYIYRSGHTISDRPKRVAISGIFIFFIVTKIANFSGIKKNLCKMKEVNCNKYLVLLSL